MLLERGKDSLHLKNDRSMLTAADSVDWVVVANEVEALALEFTWIKEYDPRFNVKYRDDKSYPYLALTVSETFPRAAVVREQAVDLLPHALELLAHRLLTRGARRRATHEDVFEAWQPQLRLLRRADHQLQHLDSAVR